jgi:hypothetical protein
MVLIVNALAVFHMKFLVYLHTVFLVHNSSISLVIIFEQKAKCRFYAVTILVF